MQNPYIPYPVEIAKIITEVDTKDIKTFRLKFVNKEDEEAFQYIPGQFGELSVYGKGESPIGIASSPTQKGYIEFTVQKAGVVTSALHEMEEGTMMGGPQITVTAFSELGATSLHTVGTNPSLPFHAASPLSTVIFTFRSSLFSQAASSSL